MTLVTGIISLIVFIGALGSIIRPLVLGRPATFGFITTLLVYLGTFGLVMSITNNLNLWMLPLIFNVIFMIFQYTANMRGSVAAAAVLNKFLPLSSILLILLIAIPIIPGLKNIIAPQLSTSGSITIAISSIIMLLIVAVLGFGSGNIILGAMMLWDFLKNNKPQVFVALIAISYGTAYFYNSIPNIYNWATGNPSPSTTSMIVFNVINAVIGIFLAIGFFSATVTNLPPNNLSFLTKLKQIFGMNAGQNFSYFKSAIKVLGSIALMVGIIYAIVELALIQFPGTVGNVITLLIQIMCAVALLAGVFRYVINNPRLLETIKNNIFMRLIFTVVMIIPCMLVYLTQGMVSSGKAAAAAAGKGASFMEKVKAVSPPKMVFAILAIEIVLISAYIVLPMFRKWIYVFTPGAGGDIVLQQRLSAVQNVKLEADKTFVASTSIEGTRLSKIRWFKIYSEKLYLLDDVHSKALSAYLISLGYKEDYGILRGNKLITDVLGKPITLASAISFIQTKNRVNTIIDNLLNIDHIKEKLIALEKQPDDGGSFTSQILNNKATYINKKTNIGSYENLKGRAASKFKDSKITPQSSDAADDYNYNYGLSSWIFLMAQPPSFGVGYSKFTKVLDYAGNPTIWYNPEINTLKITINAYKKDTGAPYGKTVFKTTDLPLQKWNNIVINVVGGTLDVFLNNKLVASVNNLIPYMVNDTINIGDNPGISGAVANVTYFSRPISQQKISFYYNNLVNKDPPII